jgi:hypothetical protein
MVLNNKTDMGIPSPLEDLANNNYRDIVDEEERSVSDD